MCASNKKFYKHIGFRSYLPQINDARTENRAHNFEALGCFLQQTFK